MSLQKILSQHIKSVFKSQFQTDIDHIEFQATRKDFEGDITSKIYHQRDDLCYGLALISIILSMGLVGVSTQINFVFEVIFFLISLMFSIPTK